MKKLLLLSIIFLVSIHVYAQFIDNMESYTEGQPISGGHWTDWNCGGGVGCAIMSTSEQAHSSSLSGMIPDDGTTNAVLDLGNKIFGFLDLSFWMYVPSGKEAYWNLQGTVPVGDGEWIVGNVFFNQDNTNPGIGHIDDSALGDVPFVFLHNVWFKVRMIIDITTGISQASWGLWVDYLEVIPWGTAFTNNAGDYPTSMGGVNFFSVSTDNYFYLDDFYYMDGVFGVINLNDRSLNIYPNPVKDILTINNTSNTEITSITIYDVLGRLVMTVNNEFNQIEISHIDSGLLFVEIETEQGVVTKKIIKQ